MASEEPTASRESAPRPAQSVLLNLPAPCLLAVLQFCAADDTRSLFNAARAHSKLHQAAVPALRNIKQTVQGPRPPDRWTNAPMLSTDVVQMDSMLLYLDKHGKHIDSINLQGMGWTPTLRQLPPHLQLTSLQFERWYLQLMPGNGFHGVLGAAARVAALKQLSFEDCELLDCDESDEGLAAVLSQLPAGLEHLSFRKQDIHYCFPTAVLEQFQHLTYLELYDVELQGPDEDTPLLQPLQALTRLVDLRLGGGHDCNITASMLSGTHHLTRLQLECCGLDPVVLVGMTKLQHIDIKHCDWPAGFAQVLSTLPPLQQLTHLGLQDMHYRGHGTSPAPAAAYSALTASSKLQCLDMGNLTVPAGVWQHLFPTGRQLPHLQELRMPHEGHAPPPDCSRLVSCCPNLQCLDSYALQIGVEGLTTLQGLTGLKSLHLGAEDGTAEGFEAICQLTELKELRMASNSTEEGLLLLQLTQLRHLTYFSYIGRMYGAHQLLSFWTYAPGDEHVWRQLLRHVGRIEPQVAQQAAAALAE